MHRPARLDPQCLQLALAAALHGSCERRFLHRLHAVLLVSLGHSCHDVACWFQDEPRTVARWAQACASSGVEALHNHPAAGRPARLSTAQVARLLHDLAGDPQACGHGQAHWSGKLVARHLAREAGVCLSVRQCQRLLKAAAARQTAARNPA